MSDTSLSRRRFLRAAGFGAVALTLGPQILIGSRAGAAGHGGITFACRGDGRVVAIDEAREAVSATIETGGRGGTLGSLTPSGDKLFVANNAADQRAVSVIDARSLRHITNVETGNRPKHPVVTPDGRLVAVNHSGLDGRAFRVAFINTADNRVAHTAELPVENTAHTGDFSMHGSFSPDGRLFAIGSYADNRVFVIDTGDGYRVTPLNVTGNPHYFDWYGREMWVTVEFGEPKGAESRCEIHVFDMRRPAAGARAQVIRMPCSHGEAENPARVEGHHGSFSNDGAKFLVCNRGGSPFEGTSVTVIDRANRRIEKHVISTANGAGHAYVSPDGRYALLTQYGDTRLPILDLREMRIVNTLNAGTGGHMGHATFSADSRKAFVSNRRADEVLVVDLPGQRITRRIATAPSGQAQGQLVNRYYNVFERVVNPHLG
ncbi:YncE family protein [Thioalkalivibrio sulfidiphilus]|uniref:YncE family protein n=1 Tax=Thioalkalivibrio sulfidiphilus TaxID=1033854 RepID=UPI00036BBAA4|nr:cytochrome D1 domain-containing protein [Thioalkalivibrio sulfidiphilus]